MEEPSFLIVGMKARMALTGTKCPRATLPHAAVGTAGISGSSYEKTGSSCLSPSLGLYPLTTEGTGP